jgi:hypothetical protein
MDIALVIPKIVAAISKKKLNLVELTTDPLLFDDCDYEFGSGDSGSSSSSVLWSVRIQLNTIVQEVGEFGTFFGRHFILNVGSILTSQTLEILLWHSQGFQRVWEKELTSPDIQAAISSLVATRAGNDPIAQLLTKSIYFTS